VELWIHDSTRPTEFTPVFLAFDQQKKNSDYNTRPALDITPDLRANGWSAKQSRSTGDWYYANESTATTQWERPDCAHAPSLPPVFLECDQQKENPDYCNTRPALDKDYGEIGLPQRIVINLQRCQTDWLSMVKRISEFDGCLPGEHLLPKWRPATPYDLGMTFLRKYPGCVFKEQPKRFFELLPEISSLSHLVVLANAHVNTKGESPSIVAAFAAIVERAESLLGDAWSSCIQNLRDKSSEVLMRENRMVDRSACHLYPFDSRTVSVCDLLLAREVPYHHFMRLYDSW